ncbi:MAG TPA: hypothetical protein VFX76_05095, partial [Roseiflexaceae bacterium]|nr:hypothetical protein [Roseiflexaceae bacterium]
DPTGHDVLAHVGRIRCPMLIVHGDADATVPVMDARRLVAACEDCASLLEIPGCDHVFNTPNPLPEDAPTSPQLQRAIDATRAFMLNAMKPKV